MLDALQFLLDKGRFNLNKVEAAALITVDRWLKDLRLRAKDEPKKEAKKKDKDVVKSKRRQK